VEVIAGDLPLEEVAEDAERLVVGPGRGAAPLVLEELLDALPADWWLEVAELEVEEVADELVEDALVVAVRAVGESPALGPQVGGGVAAERQTSNSSVAVERNAGVSRSSTRCAARRRSASRSASVSERFASSPTSSMASA
jgi:hypothetical protein